MTTPTPQEPSTEELIEGFRKNYCFITTLHSEGLLARLEQQQKVIREAEKDFEEIIRIKNPVHTEVKAKMAIAKLKGASDE